MDLGEIGQGLAILGASEVTKDAIQKMLAPTAEYIGAGLLSGTRAAVNLARVLVEASRRHSFGNPVQGEIPPRVLKGVFDDAPFCEDEVMAEYLGGILASSWTSDTRDDRGITHLATIKRLSTYSLRAHCILYTTLVALHYAGDKSPLHESDAAHIPESYFLEAMAYADGEDKSTTWAHSIVALEREHLAKIGPAGSAQYYREHPEYISAKKALRLMQTHGGMIFGGTSSGFELFFAACGLASVDFWSISDDLYHAGRLTMEHGPLPCASASAVRRFF
jgi:hypothetical protein